MGHISLVTLGVSDVARATAFYEAMGWRRSPASTPEVCFLVGGNIALALWGRVDLAGDARLPLAPAGASARLSLAMNQAGEVEVDDVLSAAEAAGGTIAKPAERTDWGGYSGYFLDLDGHLWEVAHNPFWPLLDDGRVVLPSDQEDRSEAEEAERHVAEFIAKADELEGPATEELAGQVLAILRDTWARVARVLGNQANNKVIATMLWLSRRSRETPPTDPEYWRLSAASTLASAMIPAGGTHLE